MYRIIVNSSGKHYNVVLGSRYCFTKKSAKMLIDIFIESDCVFTVEKLIRIHSDIFCFTDNDTKDKVFKYYTKKVLDK